MSTDPRCTQKHHTPALGIVCCDCGGNTINQAQLTAVSVREANHMSPERAQCIRRPAGRCRKHLGLLSVRQQPILIYVKAGEQAPQQPLAIRAQLHTLYQHTLSDGHLAAHTLSWTSDSTHSQLDTWQHTLSDGHLTAHTLSWTPGREAMLILQSIYKQAPQQQPLAIRAKLYAQYQHTHVIVG